MRLHWIAATFLLGLIVVLDPTHTPAQFQGKGGDGGGFPGGGGKGGKGGKGKKGGGGDFGGGGFPGGGGFQGGGGGFQGGGAFPPPGGGGFPGGGGGFQGGGGGFPGGGGRDFSKGGGGFPGGGGGFPGGGGGNGGFPGGGGGFPGGGGGGPNRGMGDPNAMWDGFARGRESINLNDPEFSRMRGMLERQGPIPPDGVITRQMFVEETTKRMAARNNGGGPNGSMTFSVNPNGPMQGNGQEFRMSFNQGGGNDRDTGFERLRQQDKDGDGRVSRAEADNKMQPNFDKIDRDGDGFVTLEEYRGYYASQNQGNGRNNNNNNAWDPNGGWGGDMNNWGNRDPRRDTEEMKPVAMRYGHLPKDLPEWFDTDDSTKDGQIALFEWRKAGKSIAEFETMDLNADGLITADELLRFHRKQADDQRIAAIMDGTGVRPTFASRGPGGKGPNGSNGGISLPGASPDAIVPERPGKGPNRDAYGERPEKGPGKGPNRDGNTERPEKGPGKGPNRDGNTERPGKGPNRDSGSDRAVDPDYDNPNSGNDSKPNPFRKGKN